MTNSHVGHKGNFRNNGKNTVTSLTNSHVGHKGNFRNNGKNTVTSLTNSHVGHKGNFRNNGKNTATSLTNSHVGHPWHIFTGQNINVLAKYLFWNLHFMVFLVHLAVQFLQGDIHDSTTGNPKRLCHKRTTWTAPMLLSRSNCRIRCVLVE